MPKSKRNKVVHLTSTKSKGYDGKVGLVEKVRASVDAFKTIYVFGVANFRTVHMKEVRQELGRDTRLFFGKNKVLRVALGRTAEEACIEGIEKVSKALSGNVGLLFTNASCQKVEAFFRDFERDDFARSGFKATEKVTMKKGRVEWAAHSMLEQLRKLRLPVIINKGIIELERDYTVCKEGEQLSPEAAQVIKLCGIQMAKFKVTLMYRFRDGEFTPLVSSSPDMEE